MVLSSSAIPRSRDGVMCQKVCWVYLEDTRNGEDTTHTTAQTMRRSNPAPTMTHGCTSRPTTASCPLSILVGWHCLLTLLDIALGICYQNFHYSECKQKVSAGLSQKYPMMIAWFNICRKRLPYLGMLSMATLQLSAPRDLSIFMLHSTSLTPPKPETHQQRP